jgi:amino acid transporter
VEKMDKNIKINKINDQYKTSMGLMWLGSAILLVCAVYMVILKTLNDVVAISVLIGAIIIITSFFSYIGMDRLKDERLMKIGTKSATWSWFTTLGFICFLLFTGFYSNRQFQPSELFGLVIFVMVITMLIVNTYFNRKGDLE